MKVLEELLGPVPVHEFLHRYFARVPFAMPDRASGLTDVLRKEELAALVEDAQCTLRIVKNARMVRDAVRLSWPEACDYYQRGHTLLLRYAQRSSLKLHGLAQAFARFFHSPVDIQVYVTPDQAQAFGWHYDLEEVFIIQMQGCKEYTLRQNTLNPLPVWDNMPRDMHFERETSRTRLTCRLEAGDWLYIPSGWWHIAKTQSESLHLSVGVMPITRLKLFEFLTKRLSHTHFWCERLALLSPPGEGRSAPTAQDRQIWQDMRAQLDALLAQDRTFEEFRAYLLDAPGL